MTGAINYRAQCVIVYWNYPLAAQEKSTESGRVETKRHRMAASVWGFGSTSLLNDFPICRVREAR